MMIRKAFVRAAAGLGLAWIVAQGTSMAAESWSCHNFGGGNCIECTQMSCGGNDCTVEVHYYGEGC